MVSPIMPTDSGVNAVGRELAGMFTCLKVTVIDAKS